MLKKFGLGLAFIGALMICGVSAIVVKSAVAEEKKEEKKCDKCGDLPSKPAKDCKCECHKPKH